MFRLLVRSLGERFYEQEDYESRLTRHGDELIPFVHAGERNRIGTGVRCDNGFRRERLLIGESRKADRRN